MTVILSPAGTGKTELMNQWFRSLQEQGKTAVWLSLDNTSNEPGTLLATLLEAFRISLALENPQEETALAIPELHLSLTRLLNHIDESNEGLTFFLDGYESVRNDEVNRSVRQFIFDLPSCVNTVISTRRPLPWTLGKLSVSGELTTLGFSDIRFDDEETLKFIEQHSPVTLDDESVHDLSLVTDGWVGALKLTLLALKPEQSRRRVKSIIQGRNKLLSEYLEENMFCDIEVDAQELLVCCAPLSRLNSSLCEAVSGLQSVAAILESLSHQHLIIVPLDENHRWYRVHPSQSRFLRDKFEQQPHDYRKEVHTQASKWYLENRFPSEAIRNSLAVDDYEAVLEVLHKHGGNLLIDGDIEVMTDCMDLLPAECFENESFIVLTFTWALVISQRIDEARTSLSKLINLLEEGKLINPATMSGVGNVDEHLEILEYRIRQAVDPGWADCEVWENLKHSQPPDAHFVLQHVGLALATAYLRKNRYSDAYATYMEVRGNAEATNSLITSVTATVRMAQIRQIQGRLAESLACCNEVLSRAQKPRNPQAPVSGIAYLFRAQIKYELNNLAGAKRDLSRAHVLIRRFKLAFYVVQADILEARIANVESGPSAALGKLTSTDRMPAHYKMRNPLELVWAAQAWFRILEKDYDTAEGLLRTLGAPIDKKGPNPSFSCSAKDELKYQALCLFLIRTGRLFTASAWLTKLLHQAESTGRNPSCVMFGGLLTLCHVCAGNKERAMRTLRQSLMVGETIGSLRNLVDLGEEIADLIQEYHSLRHSGGMQSDRGPSAEYMEKLIAVARGAGTYVSTTQLQHPAPSPSLAHQEEMLSPLTTREVEILAHIADGLSNRAISEELLIGEGTVKWHTKNIFSKLGVNSRTQATAKAHLHKLIN
jgi:LuxR family maltose regulon positive regulatory protein